VLEILGPGEAGADGRRKRRKKRHKHGDGRRTNRRGTRKRPTDVDTPPTDEPLPIGERCTLSGQCASGVCADGVCCSGGCDGACEACNQPGRVGTCTIDEQCPTDLPFGAACDKNLNCASGLWIFAPETWSVPTPAPASR
jgi:hypothetical protein